jgi:hypothetical protein
MPVRSDAVVAVMFPTRPSANAVNTVNEVFAVNNLFIDRFTCNDGIAVNDGFTVIRQ